MALTCCSAGPGQAQHGTGGPGTALARPPHSLRLLLPHPGPPEFSPKAQQVDLPQSRLAHAAMLPTDASAARPVCIPHAQVGYP